MNTEMKYFDFNIEPGKKLNKSILQPQGKPLVTILTAYYNAQKYLTQTANSILNQSFPYWEWIIIDDGSTEEGTKKFLDDLAKSDSRIKILTKENGGCSAARYYGAKHAQAELLYILDADDLIEPTMLECGYWAMITNPSATWAYSNSVGFGTQKYLWNKSFDFEIEKKENLLIVASFIKKAALLEFEEYEYLEKGIYEDWYMWMNFFKKGYFPLRMNFYGFWYRRLDNSMLSDIRKYKAKHKYAMSKITSVAKTIHHKIEAIQFPIIDNEFSFGQESAPFKWKFNLKHNDKRKDVLLILPWAVVGGADKFNIDLVSRLDKNKFRITIITTEPCEYIWRQKLEQSATFFDLTTFLKKKDWFAFIYYIIKSRNIKLILNCNSMYGYQSIPLIKAYFPEIPIADYLHNEDFSWNNGGYPYESISVSKFLDKTYTCTNYLKELMFSKMGRVEKNVSVAYIGTDANYFDPSKVDIESNKLYEKLKSKKIILFPCRMTEQKRPMLMLKILESLIAIDSEIVFLAVGDGNLKNKVVSKSLSLKLNNNIIFLPNQSDMRPFYKMANLTLICSMYEGLTLTTYESLAMGIPVITSDVGGQSEIVDNSCGRVIKLYQNPELDVYNYNYSEEEIREYADAIIKLLGNETIKNNCRKKIQSKFTLEHMVKKFDIDFDLLTSNPSIVEKKACENIEFSERYLAKCYEASIPYYHFTGSLCQRINDRLWSKKSWRIFMGFVKKTGLVKLKKKVVASMKKHMK